MEEDFDVPSNQNEEDLSLPKATMNKFIQELMPPEITATKETRDLLTECCVEFIHLVSSESNEVCEKESKKTIAGDHVITALKNLGFEEYVVDMQELLQEHQKIVKQDREKKISRKDNSGMTEEEMIKAQEEMFKKARERLQSGVS
jgi:histone H3/H4